MATLDEIAADVKAILGIVRETNDVICEPDLSYVKLNADLERVKAEKESLTESLTEWRGDFATLKEAYDAALARVKALEDAVRAERDAWPVGRDCDCTACTSRKALYALLDKEA